MADALKLVLDRERDALLAGHYDALEEISATKARLAADLEAQSGISDATLEALRRNHRLLAAARAGFQSGRERLAELMSVQDGFTSYDSRGIRAHRPLQVPEVSKSV